MGRCATCRKRVGFLGRKWRKLDGRLHCVPCAPLAMERRRQEVIGAILAESVPQVLFAAPAISRDIDYPTSYRRYTGILLLTDRGVVFAQFGEYKKAVETGAVFGLAGAVVDHFVENDRREVAEAQVGETGDLPEVLQEAEQVFWFPADSLRSAKFSGKSVLLRARKYVPFEWSGGKEAVKPHRDLLAAYASAIAHDRDIMRDCEAFLPAPSPT